MGEVEVVVDDAGNKDDVVAAPFQDRGAFPAREGVARCCDEIPSYNHCKTCAALGRFDVAS